MLRWLLLLLLMMLLLILIPMMMQIALGSVPVNLAPALALLRVRFLRYEPPQREIAARIVAMAMPMLLLMLLLMLLMMLHRCMDEGDIDVLGFFFLSPSLSPSKPKETTQILLQKP
jgi:hypothetical protein